MKILQRSGCEFLGWTEDPEYANKDEITYSTGIQSGDIGNKKYYAVWGGNFYVYHSSNKMVETIYTISGKKFNIYERCNPDYLYGGYYSRYENAGNYTGGEKDPNISYTDIEYSGGKNMWIGRNAYTESGKKMTPEIGRTYYLKEVPNGYLRPYMHVVYDGQKRLQELYLVMDIDDSNYRSFSLGCIDGRTYTGGTKTDRFRYSSSLTVNAGGTLVISVANSYGKKYGVSEGFVAIWKPESLVGENKDVEFRPQFVTPDNITTQGKTTRYINTGNGIYYGTWNKTLDDGTDNPGIYREDRTE